MLSTAKPTLQNDLKKVMEAAAYDAYMELFCKNQVSEAKTDSDAKDAHEKIAKAFSKTFASKASGPVATAIHDFVKEIGISCTIPPSVISPITPVIPGGPCSGTIPPTSFSVM